MKLSSVSCHTDITSNITSVAYIFPQSLCTLKTTITFSYTWSCSDRKLESRKNAHQHEQWFGYTFPVFFTRGSQHVLQPLINYSFCEVHRHYGLHYIAEETEVHQISRPSIYRGWVPTGPNKSELWVFSTCKYLPARLPIKRTADLETTQECQFTAPTFIAFPTIKRKLNGWRQTAWTGSDIFSYWPWPSQLQSTGFLTWTT